MCVCMCVYMKETKRMTRKSECKERKRKSVRISRMRIFSSSNKKQKKRQKELGRKDERIKKEQKKNKNKKKYV